MAPAEMREVARFGLPSGLAGAAVVGYGNVDYLILGATLSPAKVGFYYRAFTLGVQYERKISAIITRLAFPVYSRTESLDHMRAVRSRVIRINASVVLPLLALLIALAPSSGALAVRRALGACRPANPDSCRSRDGPHDQ